MPTELVWRPKALEDLIDLYVTIGLDSEVVAERIYAAIESRARSLIEFPRLGPRRMDISPTARMLVEGSYLLLYELRPDTDDGPVSLIEIVRIAHGHRELTELF